MNRMKQILEGNDIELLLNEVISNVFHKDKKVSKETIVSI